MSCFISHAWGNEGHQFAMDLSRALRGKRIKVWIDEEQMPPGTPIMETIRRGIGHKSDVFLFVLSPEALTSRMCKRELAIARHEMCENGKPIIPILFKDCKVPRYLKNILYADFRSDKDFSNSLDRLIKGIADSKRIRRMCKMLADHPDPEQRSKIAENLCELKNPLALGPLKNRLLCNEFDGTVKYWIALAIGEIGGKEAVTVLQHAMREEDLMAGLGVIQGMTNAFESLSEKEFNQSITILYEAIDSVNPTERICAVRILVCLCQQREKLKFMLSKLINDSDENIQRIIEQCFKKGECYESTET